MNKDKIAVLRKLQRQACCYDHGEPHKPPSMCDCKYGGDAIVKYDSEFNSHGEGTGCPELREAIYLLEMDEKMETSCEKCLINIENRCNPANFMACKYHNFNGYVPINPDFEQLEKQVIEWRERTGLRSGATIDKAIIKATAELGELATAILEEDRPGIEEEIGDMFVVLIGINDHFTGGNKSIVNCLQTAYDKIKDRKGKMSNGTFIKEE